MHHFLLFTTITLISTMPSSSSNSKPKSSNHTSKNLNFSHSHAPSATLDILILILVLFSATFLLSSYFSYIFTSLSLLLSHFTPHIDQSHILGFFFFFVGFIFSVKLCFFGGGSRKCGKPGCRGLKKGMEFDVKLQKEETLRSGCDENEVIDKLAWKGGSENNPDYECLRCELRNMAPPGGRAVLIFRTKCGCPVAKLEGWAPKKGKRNHKKCLPSNNS